MTDTNARELVERFRKTISREDNPNIIAAHVDDVSAMCDALSAALDRIAEARNEGIREALGVADNMTAKLFSQAAQAEKDGDDESTSDLLEKRNVASAIHFQIKSLLTTPAPAQPSVRAIAERIAINLGAAGYHDAEGYVLSDWMAGQIAKALASEDQP